MGMRAVQTLMCIISIRGSIQLQTVNYDLNSSAKNECGAISFIFILVGSIFYFFFHLILIGFSEHLRVRTSIMRSVWMLWSAVIGG